MGDTVEPTACLIFCGAHLNSNLSYSPTLGCIDPNLILIRFIFIVCMIELPMSIALNLWDPTFGYYHSAIMIFYKIRNETFPSHLQPLLVVVPSVPHKRTVFYYGAVGSYYTGPCSNISLNSVK